MNQAYLKELVSALREKRLTKDQLSRLKVRLCAKHGVRDIPTDIEVFLHLDKEDAALLGKFLRIKPVRSLSGVAVCAVMTMPRACPHGKCSYCPGGPGSAYGDVPQSYTGKEPATRRASRNDYDPYLQVFNRLEQYIAAGHLPEKLEVIIMGGTFPSYPKQYRDRFVTLLFKAMNDFSDIFLKKGFDIQKFKSFFELPGNLEDTKRAASIKRKVLGFKRGQTSLEREQKRNEKSHVRCIGLTIETRPDYATLRHARDMLRLGCTRVELGVQTLDDGVLQKSERGHTVQDTIDATRTLKGLGFKINYHIMPGLPGSTPEQDLGVLKRLFSDRRFQPDMLKIYPCMVMKGTKLFRHYKKGKYKPLTTAQAARLIAEMKRYVPIYVRIMRVQRDIPTHMSVAGVDRTNLRQYVDKEMQKLNIECNCIRCREIGRVQTGRGKTRIRIQSYHASEGTEFFVSAESGNALLGFCRLRLPSESLRKEITDRSALVRELHVYGETVGIGRKGEVQHTGLGRRLLARAERIARENCMRKMVVISGIGARPYYRKLRYRLQSGYMIKQL
jgi:elongator complex protein 3